MKKDTKDIACTIEVAKKENPNVDKLWCSYFKSKESGSPDRNIERELVNNYYWLVCSAANKMHQKITELSADELASMGVDGLYQSIRNFDTSRETKFETYASYRIRGSMLDAIRKADWVPRLVRSRISQFEKQRQIAESEAGYRLSNSELAEKIGMSEEEFEDMFADISMPLVHRTSEVLTNKGDDLDISIENISDNSAETPIGNMLKKEMFHKLMGKHFTPVEREIIWLYYYEDMAIKDISSKVELGESRVSQMHNMILERLRKKINRNPEYFSDIWEIFQNKKVCQ